MNENSLLHTELSDDMFTKVQVFDTGTYKLFIDVKDGELFGLRDWKEIEEPTESEVEFAQSCVKNAAMQLNTRINDMANGETHIVAHNLLVMRLSYWRWQLVRNGILVIDDGECLEIIEGIFGEHVFVE